MARTGSTTSRLPLPEGRREPPVDRRFHVGLHALGVRDPDPFIPDGLHLGRGPAGRLAEDETLEHLGVFQGQDLADHAAHGKTDEEGPLDAQGQQEAADVLGELIEGVRTLGGIASRRGRACRSGAHGNGEVRALIWGSHMDRFAASE